MAQLRQDWQKFSAAGTQIIVTGPEDMQKFQEFWKKEQLPFIGLPDPNKVVLNMYAQKFNFLKLGRMPAQFLIGSNGIIYLAHYGNSMQDIIDNETILHTIEQMATPEDNKVRKE